MDTYIGSLRRILVARLRRHLDVLQPCLVVLALTMLTKKYHHTQALYKHKLGHHVGCVDDFL